MPIQYPDFSKANASSSRIISLNWKGRPFKIAVAVVCLTLFLLLRDNAQSTGLSNAKATTIQTKSWHQHLSWARQDDTLVSLVPGELPGYTGWGRPAMTLAGHFELKSPDIDMGPPSTIAGEPWEMTIQCSISKCKDGGALFFVRAYGPAIIMGRVQDNKDGSYQIQLLPKDPGPYTVEVVLTFSDPPSFGRFPLPENQPEPPYEGFLLPNFPIPLQVLPKKEGGTVDRQSLPLCPLEVLLDTSFTSAWNRSRWVVTDKTNHPKHVINDQYRDLTPLGYEESYNSLGIQMDYQNENCNVLSRFTPEDISNPLHECTKKKGPLHFIFVGDSNMRLQLDVFEEFFLGLPEIDRGKSHYNQHNIRASLMEIYGGALRCALMGEDNYNVTRFFQTILARADTTREPRERYVVLFNTGMHDIHRLCSQEFASDRVSYLGANSVDVTQGFHCVQQYRMAVEGLAADVMNFPAALKVFQSTTAGWPKYGNYGVVWPFEGTQNMPVATEFIDFFNRLAYDIMKDGFPDIPIMDGFWVSYSRPDNREIAGKKKALEKKLSHPGKDVVYAMLRTWSTIVAQSKVCAS